jgi:hypothetical protein
LSNPTRRKVTLFDLFTLITATAVGLALLRVCIDGMEDRVLAKSPGALIQSCITAGRTYASCFLAPWGVALLVLKFRAPRAPFQRGCQTPTFGSVGQALSVFEMTEALDLRGTNGPQVNGFERGCLECLEAR